MADFQPPSTARGREKWRASQDLAGQAGRRIPTHSGDPSSYFLLPGPFLQILACVLMRALNVLGLAGAPPACCRRSCAVSSRGAVRVSRPGWLCRGRNVFALPACCRQIYDALHFVVGRLGILMRLTKILKRILASYSLRHKLRIKPHFQRTFSLWV